MGVDWIVVGAGFTGASFAERMASSGKRVLLLDRRNHVAGNAFDENNDRGVKVHRYGPHIFHTNSAVVWKYLSLFTTWRPYEHRVLGLVDGKLVPIPINLDSLASLFSSRDAARIEQALIASYGFGKKVPVLRARESGNGVVREFAEYVYRNVFENYTIKQWQLNPEQLSHSVTARVPISIDRDDRYFSDIYQAMPAQGYAALFERMLDHPNIEVVLGCDASEAPARLRSGTPVLFTGAIDELLDYRFRPLPYRSLKFEQATFDEPRRQPVAIINYPSAAFPYTRITEMKVLTGQDIPITTTITEYPLQHEPGRTVAYYPIPRDENQALYARYLEAARAEYPHMLFAGRLADYQYYNMDQACARALKLASSLGGPAWREN